MAQTVAIEALPNEILNAVLSSFNTKTLLPIALTSHRFCDVIAQILRTRLLNASALKGHKLILECFHPSTRTFTPYLFVDNLGTGTCDDIMSEPHFILKAGDAEGFGKLKGLYSHFRPLLPEEVHRMRRRRAGSWGFDQSNSLSEIQTELVCQNVQLESHEPFSQLCTLTKLVKEGQKPGIFSSWVNISGGVIRVWRDWLAERCRSLPTPNNQSSRHSSNADDCKEPNRCLLWADPRENIGLRIRVVKREDIPATTQNNPNEEASVSYTLEYEELVIRSTQLLLALDLSNDQQVGASSKGVIIGPWN